MTHQGAVTNRLTKAHPNLSPQVRKVVAYVLDHPGEVATTAFIEALIGVKMVSSGAEAINNIETIEGSRKALGEYLEGQ